VGAQPRGAPEAEILRRGPTHSAFFILLASPSPIGRVTASSPKGGGGSDDKEGEDGGGEGSAVATEGRQGRTPEVEEDVASRCGKRRRGADQHCRRHMPEGCRTSGVRGRAKGQGCLQKQMYQVPGRT
jgi:hypothetical protein